ncbi:MAG: hypothetical protein U5K00_10180 [Melioribacteraceae bacterium]|nr:hypothetical protein [Melioribacteraceae bacterium]
MKKLFLIIISVFIFNINSYSQCSDGGVCSIGGHIEKETTTPFELSFGYSYGYSGKDDDISYSSFKLGGTYNFYENASLHFTIPFNIQSGPLYDTHGIGDLIFNLRYRFELDRSRLSVSAGVRLATASENKYYVTQPYKSGLGTNDILFGVDYSFNNFNVGAGYQIAGKRGEDTEDLLVVERGDDLLLRAGYFFELEQLSINPQLLFIKRLSESSVLVPISPDAIGVPYYIEVPGSDQSQLNLLVNTTYNVNENYSHFVEAAIPFLEREVNVDGLKRTFTISTGLSFSF